MYKNPYEIRLCDLISVFQNFTRFSFHKIKNLNILRLSPYFLSFSQDDSQEVYLREC